MNINKLKNFIICMIDYRSFKLFICNEIAFRKIHNKNILFPHPLGIVLPASCTLGNNCTIYQNVTIGAKKGKYPSIGNKCIIYPNSCIIGGITIGDNCIVGAGSVVLCDVPSNFTVAGNPAKVIK